MQYLKNVSTLVLNIEACIGCTRCVQVCPHAVFEMVEKRAHIIDLDDCMECGACALNCPVDALKVDSGVGCAMAMIVGALRGTEPTCECRGGS